MAGGGVASFLRGRQEIAGTLPDNRCVRTSD